VTLASVTTGGGPVVIASQGSLLIDSVNAGRGDVTLVSIAGPILDAISGGASATKPNVSGGIVTLNAAKAVGTNWDRVYVNAVTINSTTAVDRQFINAPPTPYLGLPLVNGVSPVTVFAAYAEAQVQSPQQLPITLIGLPMRMAPPIGVTTDSFGISLPGGVDSNAAQQDSTLDTASKPIEGGNDNEIGRQTTTLKLKTPALKQSKRNGVKQTQWES
jgi:hypothetical protein